MPRISHIPFVLLSAALCTGCAAPGWFKEQLHALKPGARTTAREHYRAAVTFERLEKFDEAADSYAAALREDPESEPARDGMTRAHRKLALNQPHATVPVVSNGDPGRSESPEFAAQAPGFARTSVTQTPSQTPFADERFSLQSVVSSEEDESLPEFVYGSPRAGVNYRRMTKRTPGGGPEIVPHDRREPGVPGRADVAAAKPVSIWNPASSQPLSPISRESLAITQDIAELQARLIDDPSDVAAIEQVIRKLADRDSKRQWLAASILDHLARGPQRPLVVAQLSLGLRDRDPQVRLQSAIALATLGPAATEALPNLRLALQDPDGAVRRASSIAIDTIGR